MTPKRDDIRAAKKKLEQLVEEATQKVTLLEQERRDLQEENQKLRDRAKLVERMREDLSQVNEKLEVLGRLTKEISSLNPDKIFETAVTKVPYILNARFASIYVLEEETGKLYLKKHTHGRPIERVIEIEDETRGLMARVVAEGKVHVFPDLDAEIAAAADVADSQAMPAAAPPPPGGSDSQAVDRRYKGLYTTRSCIVAPLRVGGKTFGVLNLADRADGKPFDRDHDGPLVKQAADLLAISIRNWRLFEKLQRQAKTDSLTKLANHQAFFDDLNREVLRAERYGAAVAVIMLDIDAFKLVNDNHGHVAGDFILEEVARALRATVRLVDTAARYGGDEFAVLLPESDLRAAMVVAERLLQRIAQQRFAFDDRELDVKVSIGVAMHHKGESATELVKAADGELYRAKREGGGRICTRG